MSKDSIPQRKCRVCGEVKPLTLEYFPQVQKNGKWYFEYRCRKCAAEHSRAHYEANREAKLKYQRQYGSEHREEKRAADRIYAAKHREEARLRVSQWKADNPDKVRAQIQNRIALKRNAPGKFTAADIRSLYEIQNGLCAYCGIRLFDDYHIDHYTPLIRGGSNWPDNLLLSCADCNLQKNDSTYDEWAAWRG